MAWALWAEIDDGTQVLVPFRTALPVALLTAGTIETIETTGEEVASC